MELLLWLWCYDSSWFFNFKISSAFYLWIWLIPFAINLFLSVSSIYFIRTECEASLRLWLFSRASSSILLCIFNVIFMIKISKVIQKETSFFENAKKIYPAINKNLNKIDFWIRRKSLVSTPGILLLFLGVISLFWSYIMFNFYFVENKFSECDPNVITILNINTYLILIGVIPIFLALLCVILIKITYYFGIHLFPNWFIRVAKCFPPNLLKIDNIKNTDS